MRRREDAHRDHIFRLGPGVEVNPAQEQQQFRIRQREQARSGVFFEEQVATEFAQPAGFAQPGLSLRVTAIPVQPQAFMRLQLQFVEFCPGYRTRTAFTIQHQGMHQPPLRVVFLEHPHPLIDSRFIPSFSADWAK